MILWRLTRDEYSQDLSGLGVQLMGSRWTDKGYAVLFTATSPSLAILEAFYTISNQDFFNSQKFSLISIFVPDEINLGKIDYEDLPQNWYQRPSNEKLKLIGNTWIASNRSLGLEVPSIYAPYDKHILLNPMHKDFRKIKILAIEPFTLIGNSLESPEVINELNKIRLKASSYQRKDNFMKDVFICHASEDKEEIVEKIVTDFQENGISVWFDKSEILWGDSITEKINEGLKISRYVIVVLSKNFLKKDKHWPKREMNAALNIEATLGQKKVLPLLVGDVNDRKEIIEELALQNDKRFMVWDGTTNKLIYEFKQML